MPDLPDDSQSKHNPLPPADSCGEETTDPSSETPEPPEEPPRPTKAEGGEQTEPNGTSQVENLEAETDAQVDEQAHKISSKPIELPSSSKVILFSIILSKL